MIRIAAILALCSSCTFAHGYAHRNDSKPDAVSLSPKMQKLDREQHSAPAWAFVGDSLLAIGGFMAGPLADGRVDESAVQPINIGGFIVTGIVFASLGYTAFKWDGL